MPSKRTCTKGQVQALFQVLQCGGLQEGRLFGYPSLYFLEGWGSCPLEADYAVVLGLYLLKSVTARARGLTWVRLGCEPRAMAHSKRLGGLEFLGVLQGFGRFLSLFSRHFVSPFFSAWGPGAELNYSTSAVNCLRFVSVAAAPFVNNGKSLGRLEFF